MRNFSCVSNQQEPARPSAPVSERTRTEFPSPITTTFIFPGDGDAFSNRASSGEGLGEYRMLIGIWEGTGNKFAGGNCKFRMRTMRPTIPRTVRVGSGRGSPPDTNHICHSGINLADDSLADQFLSGDASNYANDSCPMVH